MEKSAVYLRTVPQRRRLGFLWSTIPILTVVSVIIYYRFATWNYPKPCLEPVGNDLDSWCPLPDVVVPQDDGLRSSGHFDGPEVLARQVQRLSAAVRVPTESFDDNGEVDEDPRWSTFNDFHTVLEDLFPLV